MKWRMSTRDLLEDLLSQRILLLDGSMGALIYSRHPTEEDYRGTRFPHHPVPLKNCTEVLVLTQPRMIEEIHRAYLDAGADIIETCTFNATPMALAEFGLQEHVFEINKTAAEACPPRRRRVHAPQPRQAALRRRQHRADQQDACTSATHVDDPGRRDVTFRRVRGHLLRADPRPGRRRRRLLLAGDRQSTSWCSRRACSPSTKYFAEHGIRLPVMVSGTIFDNGRTLSAQTLEAFYVSVAHFDMLSVGFNCGVGVDMIRPHVETLVGHRPQADQLLPQRRPARRHGRLRRQQRATRPRPWASSPATAGSTSSAAAAAPRRNGSPPSPQAVEGRAAAPRCRTCRPGPTTAATRCW